MGSFQNHLRSTLNIHCKHDTKFLAWENYWTVHATYCSCPLQKEQIQKKWIIPLAWNMLPLRCLRDIHMENIPEVVRYMGWKLRAEDIEWRNFRMRMVIKLWKRIILSKKSKEWEKFRVLISSSVTTLRWN